MKRWLCFLLLAAALLPAWAASGETRTETLWLEGRPVELTLTRLDSALGLTLWYDAALFEPREEAEDAERFLRPGDGEAAHELVLYRAPAGSAVLEAAREEAVALLSVQGGAALVRDTAALFEGRESFGVYAVSGEEVRELYGVRGPGGFVFLSLRFPLSSLDSWGSRAYALIQSLRWTP